MLQKKLRFLCYVLLVFALVLPQNQALALDKDAIVGEWITPESKSRIQIFKKGAKYYGKIIWLKEPNRNGKPKTDEQNPDAAKKKRPIIGLELLRDFEFKTDHWESGKIYNPEDGKEYSCTIKFKDAQTLEVRGYVLNPVLGKTQLWKRHKK